MKLWCFCNEPSWQSDRVLSLLEPLLPVNEVCVVLLVCLAMLILLLTLTSQCLKNNALYPNRAIRDCSLKKTKNNISRFSKCPKTTCLPSSDSARGRVTLSTFCRITASVEKRWSWPPLPVVLLHFRRLRQVILTL